MSDKPIETPEMRELELTRTEKRLLGEIENAKAELDTVMQAINRGKEELRVRNVEVTGLENKILTLTKTANDYSTQKEAYEKELDTLNETIKLTRDSITKDNERAKEVKEALTTIEEDLKARIAKGEERENAAISTLTAERVKLQTEVDALADDLKKAETTIAGYESTVAELVEKRKEVGNELTKLTAEVNELNRIKEGALKVVKDASEKFESAEKALSVVSAQKTELEASCAQIQASIEALIPQKTTIETDIAKLEEQYQFEKTKLFNISRREQHVTQQEEYIREQFKFAGLAYTEFSE